MQHPEAQVTEETRVTRSKPVVGGNPSSDVEVADGTLLGDDPELVCEKWIQLLVQAVVRVGQSDVCDDDEMFAVSLMTVEVREAHFHFHIHKSCVLHLGLAVGWEVVGLCPFNDNRADVLTLGVSRVIIENSFQKKKKLTCNDLC